MRLLLTRHLWAFAVCLGIAGSCFAAPVPSPRKAAPVPPSLNAPVVTPKAETPSIARVNVAAAVATEELKLNEPRVANQPQRLQIPPPVHSEPSPATSTAEPTTIPEPATPVISPYHEAAETKESPAPVVFRDPHLEIVIPTPPAVSETHSLVPFTVHTSTKSGDISPSKFADDLKSIGDVSTFIRPSAGDLPPNYAAAKFEEAGEEFHLTGMQREWVGNSFTWEAPAIAYRPLYFEQVNLERHGYRMGPIITPVASGAHFFSRLPMLPYLIALDKPHRPVYNLGHYRPGSYAPYQHYTTPFKAYPTLIEATAIAGAFALFP